MDISDFFFFARGRGKGSPRRREGWGMIFYWKSQEGGLPGGWGRGARGAGRVFAGNVGGGGAKYFFFGPKFPPRQMSRPDPCSVDFGREAPKFRFEFCRGFFDGFFPPVFSKEKGPKKSTKKSPGTLSRKIPLGFLQKPSLDKCNLGAPKGSKTPPPWVP